MFFCYFILDFGINFWKVFSWRRQFWHIKNILLKDLFTGIISNEWSALYKHIYIFSLSFLLLPLSSVFIIFERNSFIYEFIPFETLGVSFAYPKILSHNNSLCFLFSYIQKFLSRTEMNTTFGKTLYFLSAWKIFLKQFHLLSFVDNTFFSVATFS